MNILLCKHLHERYGGDQNIIICVMYHISNKHYLYVDICIQIRHCVSISMSDTAVTKISSPV